MNMVSKLLVFSLLVLSSAAHAINIDGDLKDWIGAPTGNSANDWKPIDSTIKYTEEDQDGSVNGGYLSPGWGGQAYDAEAIYVTQDALNFYVAVVTGLAPNTISYPAGDLAFDFGNDRSYEYGVVVESPSLNTNTNVNNDHNGGIGNQGDVYKVSQWNVGLWRDNGSYIGIGQGTQAHPTTVKEAEGNNRLGLAQIVYKEAIYDGDSLINNLGLYNGTHYLIEAKISKNFFNANDLSKPFTVHWTMSCANDSIWADPLPSNVPTPTTLPMLALGLTLLTAFRRNPNQNARKIGFSYC